MSTSATAPGTTAFLASDVRYYGKVTVESVLEGEGADQVLTILTSDGRRGRCFASQLYSTAGEAKLAVSGAGDANGLSEVMRFVRQFN